MNKHFINTMVVENELGQYICLQWIIITWMSSINIYFVFANTNYEFANTN